MKSGTAKQSRSYEQYVDHGVAWLGLLPNHWEVRRLKRIFRVLNGSTPRSSVGEFWDGEIPWITPDDLGQVGSQTILSSQRYITQKGYESCGTSMAPRGSLVLSTRAPIGHLAIAGIDLCTNQGCRCLVFREEDDTRYFYYQMSVATSELESWGQGSTFTELARSKLEIIVLACPPYVEQLAIGEFLDQETERIDALIEKKERQIELFQEKRATLISHAITRGLNPNVKMKDSGIEWLVEIPQHWEVVRFKFLLSVPLQYGANESAEYDEPSWPRYVRITDINENGTLCEDTFKSLPEDVAEPYLLRQGDLLFARSGATVGKTFLYLESWGRAAYAGYLIRARLKSRCMIPAFAAYFCRSDRYWNWLRSSLIQATIQNVSAERYANMVLPVPRLSEQREIVAHLDAETSAIDRVTETIALSTETLREYRTALISAAVTGKIDVRNTGAGRSGLSKRLIAAAEYLFVKQDAESALTPICSAIDRVSQDMYKASGREVYKRFVHDRMEFITRIAFSNIAILKMRFAIAPIYDQYGNSIRPEETDAEGNRLYSFEQIIYHLVRCKLIHDCEVSHVIQDSGRGSGRISVSNDVVYLPFDAIALGLLLVLLTEVPATDEFRGTILEHVCWNKIPLIEFVGNKARVLEHFKSDFDSSNAGD